MDILADEQDLVSVGAAIYSRLGEFFVNSTRILVRLSKVRCGAALRHALLRQERYVEI